MSVQIDSALIDQSEPFSHAVLELVHRVVMDEAQVDLATGCVLHPGVVRSWGGRFVAKQVLFEHMNGPLDDGVMLVRQCSQPACQAAEHHVAMTRKQFGSWLGRGGWRQQKSA